MCKKKIDLFQTIFRIDSLVAGKVAPPPLTPCFWAAAGLYNFWWPAQCAPAPVCHPPSSATSFYGVFVIIRPPPYALGPEVLILRSVPRVLWDFFFLYGRELGSQPELYSPVIRLDWHLGVIFTLTNFQSNEFENKTVFFSSSVKNMAGLKIPWIPGFLHIFYTLDL